MKDKTGSDSNEKSRTGSVILTVIAGICVLLAFAAFYVLTVVLSGQDVSACAPETAESAGMKEQTGSRHFTDVYSLRQALGIPLPETVDAGVTDAYMFDDTCAGKAVWHARVIYENGAVLDIVMPSAAASVLQRNGLKIVSDADCDVCNLNAVLCEGNGENCLLFTDENAAFSLYMPRGRDELLRFAAAMRMAE